MSSKKSSVSCTDELYKSRDVKWQWEDLFTIKTLALLMSPLVVAILGSASRGDIFLYLVLAWVNWDKILRKTLDGDLAIEKTNDTLARHNAEMNVTSSDDVMLSPLDELLHGYRLDQVYYAIPSAILVSYLFFFGIGGFLQWHYYIKQRHNPEQWKCQPKKFLDKKDERHEILLGSLNLILGSVVSGVLSSLAMNGANVTRLYFNVSDYGWLYLIVTTIITFMYQDAAAYYIHRMLHFPFFYKNFHKMHHRYHSPTAFSAVAMHPVEFLTLQISLMIPVFCVPLHWASFLGCVFYVYYYGMIDHSGIDLEAVWPWQPPVRFHDDHHKYFHVNFGFNTMLFDRVHDTLRKKSRKYNENIFGGKGVERADKLD